MRKRKRRKPGMVEMQMGPMIDMVFLLLVFFMVSAKPIQPESDIPIGLPGQVAQEEALDIPDEQRVEIQRNGQVILNEMTLDLDELAAVLTRFKKSADAAKSEALVTVAPHDEVRHQRLVDVLNACAEAGIKGVTLAAGGAGEGGAE